MGFAVWLSEDQAWAQGTHEYRPMGCAVIARNGQFRSPDFNRYRRSPDRRSPLFNLNPAVEPVQTGAGNAATGPLG